MAKMPTAREIHEAGEELGLLEDGQLPRKHRAQVVEAIWISRGDKPAPPTGKPASSTEPTAKQLVQFRTELYAAGLPQHIADEAVAEAARVQLRTTGLILQAPDTEGNPTP